MNTKERRQCIRHAPLIKLLRPPLSFIDARLNQPLGLLREDSSNVIAVLIDEEDASSTLPLFNSELDLLSCVLLPSKVVWSATVAGSEPLRWFIRPSPAW